MAEGAWRAAFRSVSSLDRPCLCPIPALARPPAQGGGESQPLLGHFTCLCPPLAACWAW